jgi:hypothetical protein
VKVTGIEAMTVEGNRNRNRDVLRYIPQLNMLVPVGSFRQRASMCSLNEPYPSHGITSGRAKLAVKKAVYACYKKVCDSC